PDTVRVESGQNLADINIELKLAEPVTARELVPDAQDLARETFPDAMLSAVYGPDVNPDGTAKMWIYRFFSESLDTLTTIIGSSVFLIDMGSDEDEDDYYYDYYYYYYYYGGYNDYDDDDPFLDDLPLPDNWIDSDVAIDSAKTNGGQAFLDQFPESEINVVLISFIWEPGEMPRVYMRGGNKNNRKILKKLLPRGVLNNTTQETDTLAIWIVDFYEIEGANEEFIIIDAITGKPVQLFPEGNPTTARFNMEMVEPKAKAWAPDAYLVAVTSHFSHISPEGLAEMWGYIYFSVSHDSSAVFIMAEGFLLYQGGLGWELMSKMPLPENWIDSDAAIAVSELNGGKVFRIENEDAWVTCGVGTGIWPFDLNKPTWQVNYDTYYGYYPSLTNYIDALTGELLKEGTAVTRDPVLPDKFSLEQNYPNPFNPETTVEYNVPELSQVNISVLNVYGQNVATLVHEDKNPGSYKVLWSGRDDKGRSLPSGVYFYRMKAGDFTAIKKMVLVR
ncbi:MAG: T9SS type A sorting domain-containing protein, partial [Bacteroidales bacterium]|nr:T9SS type A sorting domain-containing protein [Bacteroidales bacterium]